MTSLCNGVRVRSCLREGERDGGSKRYARFGCACGASPLAGSVSRAGSPRSSYGRLGAESRPARPARSLARSARALSSTVGGFVRWAAAIAGYERFLKHVLPALR